MSPSCAPSTITRSHSRPFTRCTVESVTCPAARGIVADGHALQVLAQPDLERRGIGMHRRDREQRGEVVEVRRVAAAARVVERAHRGAEPDVVADRAQHAWPRRPTRPARRGRRGRRRTRGSDRCRPSPSVSAWARSVASVQRRRLRIVSTTLAVMRRFGPAHDLGEVGAAQLAAVGDRAREPEVGERAAHAGAAQEVLADRGRDRQAAVVREHLHRRAARR